jgi:hypothetical protein
VEAGVDDALDKLIEATLDPALRQGLTLSQSELRRQLGAPELGGQVDCPPTRPPEGLAHVVEVSVRSSGPDTLEHALSLRQIPPNGLSSSGVSSWRHDVSRAEVAVAATAVKQAAPEELRDLLLALVGVLTTP